MKVHELIERLRKYNQETEVAILDGFNGGGQPRAINFGPLERSGWAAFPGDEQADYSDLETEPGKPIVVMGYGCY